MDLGNLVHGIVRSKLQDRILSIIDRPTPKNAGDILDLHNLARTHQWHDEMLLVEAILAEQALRKIRKGQTKKRSIRSTPEKDLEDYLMQNNNLEYIEAGLRPVSQQQAIVAGITDIIARDQKGQEVIIELKAAPDKDENVHLQIRKYMGARPEARHIFVAPNISKNLFFSFKPEIDRGDLSLYQLEEHNGIKGFNPVTEDSFEGSLEQIQAFNSMLQTRPSGAPARNNEINSLFGGKSAKRRRIKTSKSDPDLDDPSVVILTDDDWDREPLPMPNGLKDKPMIYQLAYQQALRLCEGLDLEEVSLGWQELLPEAGHKSLEIANQLRLPVMTRKALEALENLRNPDLEKRLEEMAILEQDEEYQDVLFFLHESIKVNLPFMTKMLRDDDMQLAFNNTNLSTLVDAYWTTHVTLEHIGVFGPEYKKGIHRLITQAQDDSYYALLTLESEDIENDDTYIRYGIFSRMHNSSPCSAEKFRSILSVFFDLKPTRILLEYAALKDHRVKALKPWSKAVSTLYSSFDSDAEQVLNGYQMQRHERWDTLVPFMIADNELYLSIIDNIECMDKPKNPKKTEVRPTQEPIEQLKPRPYDIVTSSANGCMNENVRLRVQYMFEDLDAMGVPMRTQEELATQIKGMKLQRLMRHREDVWKDKEAYAFFDDITMIMRKDGLNGVPNTQYMQELFYDNARQLRQSL